LTWYPFTYILQPTVETNPATEISATKAKLNGTLSNLGAASAATVWFEWSDDRSKVERGEGTKVPDPPAPKSSLGKFSEEISGLSPSTTYHFRAGAENTHGTSYGKVLSFTTTARPEFNFTLRYESTGNLIPPGGNTDLRLIVENVPDEAERQTVNFSFSVQPPENGNANDITFNPTQPSCSAGGGQTSCNVTVTISASNGAHVGDYQITITGTAPNGKGGSVSKTTSYTLTVGGTCEGEQKRCWNTEEGLQVCKVNNRQFNCENEQLGICDKPGGQSCRTNSDCLYRGYVGPCVGPGNPCLLDVKCCKLKTDQTCDGNNDCYAFLRGTCNDAEMGYCGPKPDVCEDEFSCTFDPGNPSRNTCCPPNMWCQLPE